MPAGVDEGTGVHKGEECPGVVYPGSYVNTHRIVWLCDGRVSLLMLDDSQWFWDEEGGKEQ